VKLGRDFYRRNDVTGISRELLGKTLCTRIDGRTTSAAIIETEAYAGVDDKASHAYGNRRTKRTEPMYADGGIAYVYLCYGIHHLFNVVTNVAGTPQAVLVRAGVPLRGTKTILQRRGKDAVDRTLLAGPGSFAKGLGIHTGHTGLSLASRKIWIEDAGMNIDESAINAGPRVGVDYAGEDAKRLYRFRIDAQHIL
jgi:DNA-3-methyladenine glycosylase